MNMKDKATRLFLEHYQYVAQVAFRATPLKSLQNDIVHDAFIQFVKTPERWNLDQDIRPILKVITERIALKYWRKHTRTLPDFVVELMKHVREDMRVHSDDDCMEDRVFALNLCMKKLTGRYQKMLQLHYFEKKTLSEVAQKCDMRLLALRKAICRARDILRNCIVKTCKDAADLGGES